MSELAEKLIAENLKTKNPVLDLGRCSLDGREKELYKPLKDATHLRTLIFYDDWYAYDTQQKIYLKKETQNPDRHIKSTRNNIHQIPTSLPKSLKKLLLAGHWDSKWSFVNLSYLGELKHIDFLDLSYNDGLEYEVKYESFFEKLNHLKGLHLRNSAFEDYTFLKSLHQLEELNISDNKIQQALYDDTFEDRKALKTFGFSFLTNLPKLQILNIASNQIEEGVFLYLDTDEGYLSSLKELKLLNLNHNQIEEFEYLESLKNLESLRFYNNRLEDISFLEKFTNLTHLDLGWNKIQNISTLTHLKKLQWLNVGENKIEDFSSLKALKNLKYLGLNSNQIQDITALTAFTSLQELDLSHNEKIENIAALQKLKQLKSLNIVSTAIRDISGLKFLENLTTLRVYADSLDKPPIWYAMLQHKGGKVGDYIHLSEPPQIEKIWQLIKTDDEKNVKLAGQLAQSQGWAEEEIQMYQNLL